MKRKEEPEETGGYSWMDTYGDMVTLLLCFFVLLYSFSSVDAGKWKELVSALSGTYGTAEMDVMDPAAIQEKPINNIDSMVSSDDSDALNAQQDIIDNTFDQLYQNIKSYISVNGIQDQISVGRTDDYIYLRFSEMALFASAKAQILPGSEEILRNIIQMIHDNISAISMVRIEGHTDTVPIHNTEFTDNWDLSAKRATNTLRLVLATGLIEETKLSAIGYGEYQPIAANDTAEGRAQNRRVDFVLVKVKVE